MENSWRFRNNKLKLVLLVSFVFFYACEDLTDSLYPRDNIVDTWKCVETDSHGSAVTFLVEVQASTTNPDGVLIYNFNNLGDIFSITANVNSSQSLSIPEQTKSGFTIKGSGTIKVGYKEMDLSYSVDDNGDKVNYTAVLTKY